MLRPHTQDMQSHSSQIGSPQMNPTHTVVSSQIWDPLVFNEFCNTLPAYLQIQDPLRSHTDHRDAVVRNLESLRTNPTISDAVNGLLASYYGRPHLELSQGKSQSAKKSGRFNTHDTISTFSHLRWPNEGFHASNRKKRLTYDELSLP